jgi:hypothetical protein
LARIDIQERAEAVLDAIKTGQRYAPAAIVEATGVELGAVLDGLLPGLLLCLCIVAATTALGTAAGAAVGALALGVGAAPGALLGASAGFEGGLMLLEGLGIAFLAGVIGSCLVDAASLARSAVNEAWHSVDDRGSHALHVDHAGRTLAAAAGVVMRGVLQGIVAYLLASGSSAAASKVPGLVSKLRASRFGQGFATWIERNWRALVTNERLKSNAAIATRVRGGTGGAGSAENNAAATTQQTQRSARTVAPRPEHQPTEAQKARPKTSVSKTVPTGERNGAPTGQQTRVLPQDDVATQRSLRRENESARLLANEGYRVEQNPTVDGDKNPDYLIEGRRFDCKAPATSRARNAASEISDSVQEGQADRTVLYLDDSKISLSEMKTQLDNYPIDGLKEVIAIKDGQVISLWP